MPSTTVLFLHVILYRILYLFPSFVANLYPSTRAQDVSVDSKGSIQSASADNRNSNSVKRNSNTKSVDALDELDAIVVDDNDDEPVSRGSKPLISVIDARS